MIGPAEASVDVLNAAALAAAARAGDREALEALLVSVEKRVYGFAYRMVGDRTAAEDVAQQALLKVCQRVGQYRGMGSFVGWVYRIVVREAHDWRRRTRHAEEEIPEAPAAPGFDPARDEQLRRVEAAMGVLSEKERAAVVLMDVEGFTSGEAARILGCLPITVRVRALQGRKKLRRELSRYYPELREVL